MRTIWMALSVVSRGIARERQTPREFAIPKMPGTDHRNPLRASSAQM
jgi:hypothetical protein